MYLLVSMSNLYFQVYVSYTMQLNEILTSNLQPKDLANWVEIRLISTSFQFNGYCCEQGIIEQPILSITGNRHAGLHTLMTVFLSSYMD